MKTTLLEFAFSPFDRLERIPAVRAVVQCQRSDQNVVPHLLENLNSPSRHAPDCEDRYEHMSLGMPIR